MAAQRFAWLLASCLLILLLEEAKAHPQYPNQNAGQGNAPVGGGGVGSGCPAGKDCVPFYLCQNGVINSDGGGLLDLRTKAPSNSQCVAANHPGEIVLCCGIPGWVAPVTSPPVTSAPQVTCQHPEVCVAQNQCNVNGYIITDGAGQQDVRIVNNNRCPLAGSQYQGNPVLGVCCLPPVPPTTPSPYQVPPASGCGFSNPNIGAQVAYNEASFGQFPWQAVVFFSNFTFKCGASIVGDRWVLTAAHCVHGFNFWDFKIRLGEWQVNSFDEPLPYFDANPKAITIHPQFNPTNVHNDVAVIELTGPITAQYHVNSICLPSPGQYFWDLGAGWDKRCVTTGWGKDAFNGNYQNILKRVDVPLVDDTTCQNQLRQTRLGQYFNLDDSFICAGGEENKDACKGDGGGPLACQQADGRFVLAGITAFGIGCGTKNIPGVYADVPALMPFIQSVISGTYAIPVPVNQQPGYVQPQQQQPQQNYVN